LRATPQARNSVSGNGRPACCGNASCIPICPIGAKYDATVHVSVAEKNGAALHAQTTATKIELGTGRRVSAVRFKRWDGSEGIARGKVFVLAAHAIETPRLLLHSRSEALPNGVANRSDQVGRNLMDHPTQLSWALSREPVWPYRGPLSTSSIEKFRHGEFRKDRPAMRIEIGNDGWSWPKGAPVTTAAEFARQGLRGRSFDTALREHASRHVRFASQVEQLPDPENRVTLDPGEKDMYGVPLPRLAYRLDDYVRLASLQRALRMRRSSVGSAPRGSSTATLPKAQATSWARRGWARMPKARWSTAIFAATTTRISSSSARPCSPPAPRPTQR
jgi:choline dehydrogenase-like flavoprotein